MRRIWLALSLLIALPTLASAQPAIVSVDPNSAVRGSSVLVTITGSETVFLQGTEVTSVVLLAQGGAQIDATSIDVTNATLLDANFDIPSDASLGLYDVSVEQVVGGVVTLVDGFTILSACAITDLAAGAQTACDPATNTYTQEVIVTFANAPGAGTLDVNGQSFAIGTSPQTVTLIGLVSDGAPVDVTASFSAEPGCSRTELALFTAPANCEPQCAITDLAAGAQTACDPATNTYTQEVIVTFENAPGAGTLDVNGQSFAIGTSPQTVTLIGLVSDGAPVDVTASFSAEPGCSRTELALFTAPARCAEGNPPDCSQAEPSTAVLWPPNGTFTNVSILGVTDPDGEDVEITITSVTSNEPTTGLAADDPGPDAVILDDGTVDLRAERFGSRSGRVYTIHFTATDDSGDSCDGVVSVTVPHDQRPRRRGGSTASLGETYDATTICTAASEPSLSQQTRTQLPLVAKVAGGQMTVLFTNETTGPVDLKILDMRGRLVRRLAARDFPAGQHTLYWDGRDRNGHMAATGVYLVRVEMGRKSHTSKTVWIR